jgi:hypothetical protein
LTFKGATLFAQGVNIGGFETVPTVTGNENFAFNFLQVPGKCIGGIRAFARENAGTLFLARST